MPGTVLGSRNTEISKTQSMTIDVKEIENRSDNVWEPLCQNVYI